MRPQYHPTLINWFLSRSGEHLPKLTTLRAALFLVALQIAACNQTTGQQENLAEKAPGLDPQPPRLNSERIRQKFGSYGLEVLDADSRVRVSNLYSLDNGEKVTRSIAVVLFPEPMPTSILAEHELVVAGGSIGEVFKSRGYKVGKDSLYFGDIAASADFDGVYEMMGGIEAVDLAVHAYELSVSKDDEIEVYAVIIEIHHPDYLDLAALKEIYSAESETLPKEESATLPGMEIVKDSLSEISLPTVQ